MKPRKTVKVVDALARANYFLANSAPDKAREREATANFLESLLHLADAYHGFRYLDKVEVERYGNGGFCVHDKDDYDESRRQYFVHRSLEADLKAAIDKLAH